MRKSLITLATVSLLLLAACSGGSQAPNDDGGVVVVTPQPTVSSAPVQDPSTAPGTQSSSTSAPGDCEVPRDDDLVVAPGQTCVISDVRIEGNIKIGAGASLQATDVTIDGDVQGHGHTDVTVIGGRVEGNIQLEAGGSALVTGVTIDGDLQAEDNAGVQDFSRNTIDGNLQCEGNDPAPIGSGNRVEGDAEDQCAALVG